MSVLIKGLNKPQSCGDCWAGDWFCDRWRNRNWGMPPPDDCPIKAAPADVAEVRHGPRTQKEITPSNADRIRALSDEELAKMISGFESFALTCGGAWSPENWLEWLKKEAKD